MPGLEGKPQAHDGERGRDPAGADAFDARVDPGGVGLEDATRGGIEPVEALVGDASEIEQSRQPIRRDPRGTHDFGRAPARRPNQPQHLGKPILGVHEAEPEEGVGLVLSLDVGEAVSVAVDADGGSNPVDAEGSGGHGKCGPRQGGPAQIAHPQAPQSRDDDERQGRPREGDPPGAPFRPSTSHAVRSNRTMATAWVRLRLTAR